MVLIRDVPQAPDLLSDSQPLLKGNNNSIDDSFGLDHYAASNTDSTLNGKHKIARWVTQSSFPTSETDIKQFSLGPIGNLLAVGFLSPITASPISPPPNLVASPILSLQSPSSLISIGPLATTTVLDFAGMPNTMAILTFSFSNIVATTIRAYSIFWNAATAIGVTELMTRDFPLLQAPAAAFSSSLLRIGGQSSATSTVSWTLDFKRIWETDT